MSQLGGLSRLLKRQGGKMWKGAIKNTIRAESHKTSEGKFLVILIASW